jgi:hypothetical protein
MEWADEEIFHTTLIRPENMQEFKVSDLHISAGRDFRVGVEVSGENVAPNYGYAEWIVWR